MSRGLALAAFVSACSLACASDPMDPMDSMDPTDPMDPTGSTGGRGGFEGTRTLDFSDFSSFSLSRIEGIGFCVSSDFVATASIEKLSDAEYEFTHQALICDAFRFEECGDCREAFPCDFGASPPFALCCVAPVSRMLNAEEVAQIKALFSSVVEVGEQDPSNLPTNNCWLHDPCLITALSWDGYRVIDDVCFEPHLEASDLQAIEEALAAFAGLRTPS